MQILPESNGAIQQDVNNIEVNGSKNVINVGSDPRKGEGIKQLLDYVQHEAIHDSSERGDFGCHPGTREEYIREITSWGNGQWESEKRAFLMTGPAGAGKSAIARDCAHKLEESGNLGASFFFYRPNSWNDPQKFIPTIVYQFATRYPTYRDCIDAIILRNPLVLKKEMKTQFLELLVKPLRQQSVNGHNVRTGLVIVIDGLDECADVGAQVQIINLIATSIREQTTPFLWAFFSRPEPRITSAFSREMPTNVPWTLPLTLCGNADSDIEAYLRGSFNMIRATHNIPPNVSWPEEEDVRHLVSQSAGLFAYAATAIRYINGLSNGRAGFEERLRAVLQADAPSAENPFLALDKLYRLLMMQIPGGILPDTLSLLCLHQSTAYRKYGGRESMVASYSLALGLSAAAFHAAISNLHSVLQVTRSQSEESNKLRFYHKSFLDFLLDEKRSELYFILSRAVHQHCLEKTICTISRASDPMRQCTYGTFPLHAFFALVEEHVGKVEESTLELISQIVWKSFRGLNIQIDFPTFIQRIPVGWHSRIIRPSGLLRIVSRDSNTSVWVISRTSGSWDSATTGFDSHGSIVTTISDSSRLLSRWKTNTVVIRRQIAAILRPEQFSGVSYILGSGDKAVFIEKSLSEWQIRTETQ